MNFEENNNNIELPKTINQESNTNLEIPVNKEEFTTNNNIVDNIEVINNNNDNKEVIPTNNMINDLKTSIKEESHSFTTFMKDIFKYLTTRNSKELLELLWRLALIAVFILLLYVPVQLFRDLSIDFLITSGVEFSERITNIYYAVFNILYCLIGIFLFFIVCKARFYNLVKMDELSKTTLNK